MRDLASSFTIDTGGTAAQRWCKWNSSLTLRKALHVKYQCDGIHNVVLEFFLRYFTLGFMCHQLMPCAADTGKIDVTKNKYN